MISPYSDSFHLRLSSVHSWHQRQFLSSKKWAWKYVLFDFLWVPKIHQTTLFLYHSEKTHCIILVMCLYCPHLSPTDWRHIKRKVKIALWEYFFIINYCIFPIHKKALEKPCDWPYVVYCKSVRKTNNYFQKNKDCVFVIIFSTWQKGKCKVFILQ